MILTPIAAHELPVLAAGLTANLRAPLAVSALRRILASGPSRAVGARAGIHRQAAIRLGRALGIPIRDGAPGRNFGWDGRWLRGRTEAYVLLHEIAHHRLAGGNRRRRREFGLGPGPETGHRFAAERAATLGGPAREREEAMASLLGILLEVELGQPALASFLDQNWLEGAERPGAAAHFERVLRRLARAGLVSRDGRPVLSTPTARRYSDRLLKRIDI